MPFKFVDFVYAVWLVIGLAWGTFGIMWYTKRDFTALLVVSSLWLAVGWYAERLDQKQRNP